MTQAAMPNRSAILASLSGVCSAICFVVFNLAQYLSDVIPGAGFISLALGVAALASGIIGLRTDPLRGIDRLCCWFGIVCGCLLLIAWIGIAGLLVSAMQGHPM